MKSTKQLILPAKTTNTQEELYQFFQAIREKTVEKRQEKAF